MDGPSRTAWAQALKLLQRVEAEPDRDLRGIAGELYSVSETLASNGRLRRALADPSRDAWPKRELAQRLLAKRLTPIGLQVVEAAVSGRWSSDRDLVDALERLGHDAVLAAAERDGNLDQVERELLECEQFFGADPDVREALHRREATREAKAELVARLLEGKVLEDTVRLAQRPVLNPRGRRYPAVIWRILSLAARRREKVTAIVTSAQPLEETQLARLAAGLTRFYGREIFLNTIVDPGLLGGLRVQVGDEVLDASVQRRLDDVKFAMGVA